MHRVYVSSQTKHADMWRALENQNDHIFIISRWLKHIAIGTPDDCEYEASLFWQEDAQDVKSADVVICFAGEGDRLRGALVEVGMAIALGVPVIVVGEHHDYGTWQHHPLVTQAEDMDQAMELLEHGPISKVEDEDLVSV